MSAGGRAAPKAKPTPAEDTLPVAGFIGRFGHVPYGQVAGKPPYWRISYTGGASCEMGGCPATGARGAVLVFDHCHRHGWVRGVLCNSHNVRVGRVEAVMALEGVTVDLGGTPYGRYLSRCPGCRNGPLDVAGLLPAKGPFAPAPRRQCVARVPADPGPPVARPGAAIAHLAPDGRRTVCGVVSDAMTVAEGKPVCKSCTRVRERARTSFERERPVLAGSESR